MTICASLIKITVKYDHVFVPHVIDNLVLNLFQLWSSHKVDTYDNRITIILSLVLLLTSSLHMIVGVCGVYHDDEIYVRTAKALAQGQGYRLINYPGSPKQTKSPILFPALLIVVWKL